MEKKLTRRQQQFLLQFLDLYREMNHPVHYNFVAERLNIGKISVYEMLRLLEYNGYVKAEFEATGKREGPGRPSVLFYPTRQAFEQTQRLAVVPSEMEQWRLEKDRILDQLRKNNPAEMENLARSLFSNLTENEPPLLSVTRNISLLLISLSLMPMTPRLKSLLSQLAHIGIPGQMNLSTFFGFSIGLAFMGLFGEDMADELLNNISRYEYYLQDIHSENQLRLCTFIHEAVTILVG